MHSVLFLALVEIDNYSVLMFREAMRVVVYMLRTKYIA